MTTFNKFDFENLYQKYPRKEGKGRGMIHAANKIRTTEDYDRLSRAVDNYAAMCKKEGKERKFMLLWQTFMAGRWEEYVSVEQDTTPPSKNLSQLERIARDEL